MEISLWKKIKLPEFVQRVQEEIEEEFFPFCTCGSILVPKFEDEFIWHPSNSF